MKNYTLLRTQLQEGINFVERQQTKLMPLIDFLSQELLNQQLKKDVLKNVSFKETLEMYQSLMEQQTNSIMLLTKIQEVLKYIE